MTLLDTVRTGIETAFAVGQEFVSVGLYHHRTGQGEYDPDEDTILPEATIIPNVRFLKTSAQVTEREASPVAVSDVKFLIPAVDMPEGFHPSETDQIEPGDGLKYNVVVSRFVPGEVIHIIFGRKA